MTTPPSLPPAIVARLTAENERLQQERDRAVIGSSNMLDLRNKEITAKIELAAQLQAATAERVAEKALREVAQLDCAGYRKQLADTRAERDALDTEARALAGALEDLLHHGFQYENGKRHQADPEKAKQLLAARAARLRGDKP